MSYKNWINEMMSGEKDKLHFELADKVLMEIKEEIIIKAKGYNKLEIIDNVRFNNGSLYIGNFEISNDMVGCNANSSLLFLKKDGIDLDWYMVIELKDKINVTLNHKLRLKDKIELGKFDDIDEQQIAYFIEKLVRKNNVNLFS